MGTVKLLVSGSIPAKKNQQRISRHGGIYKPQPVQDFETLMAWHCRNHRGAIGGAFGLRGTFYIPKGKDMDNCLTTVLDCLQQNGVIRNDNDWLETDGLRKEPTKAKYEHLELELYPLT